MACEASAEDTLIGEAQGNDIKQNGDYLAGGVSADRPFAKLGKSAKDKCRVIALPAGKAISLEIGMS